MVRDSKRRPFFRFSHIAPHKHQTTAVSSKWYWYTAVYECSRATAIFVDDVYPSWLYSVGFCRIQIWVCARCEGCELPRFSLPLRLTLTLDTWHTTRHVALIQQCGKIDQHGRVISTESGCAVCWTSLSRHGGCSMWRKRRHHHQHQAQGRGALSPSLKPQPFDGSDRNSKNPGRGKEKTKYALRRYR